MNVTLAQAQSIVAAALDYAAEKKLNPLVVGVLDARGALIAFAAQDNTPLKRADIALGKAKGAIAMGLGSRALLKRAEAQPFFIAAAALATGGLIPVPGGVLIKSEGKTIGAVGISGDTSDNDEAAAIAGIKAVGFEGDGG